MTRKSTSARAADWEAIKADYRTGQYSGRELAKKYGLNPSTVGNRIRREGWEKDLNDQIKHQTNGALARVDLPKDEEGQPRRATDEEVIAIAASINVAVIEEHRADLRNLRKREELVAKMFDQAMKTGLHKVTLRGIETLVPFDMETAARALATLTTVMERRIRLQRQAHNLDEDDSGTSYEDALEGILEGPAVIEDV